jgi:hypothetical protein
MHLTAVQEANRRFDAGEHPAMMRYSGTKGRLGDFSYFEDIVERIFAAPTRSESEAIIEYYDRYWRDIIGTRGFKGEKTVNARTQHNAFFDYDTDDVNHHVDDSGLDESALDKLEKEQQ